ncbi:FAD-dependent oxidoreductase [Kineosporia sp. J2-2]|uniref:FAD-dependent oxidoreductase n=1 Tax=Kineosporia corallincola TaxID=2835133 RepID=A0ABS5T8I8_9ACTN|nr:FAD-dependent oxidoreductase [Kineosporia corallincola]MBT0767386.1 FAD-dependent oxidoreductase [Kineosporia corallincola]
MSGPRVVIVGAGVVGAALADELSERGWTQITVVEQGELPRPGGSSSHAPGLVFQTNSSKTMAQLAKYTVEKLVSLDLDGEPCFLQVGGLEVATTPERLAELHRRAGWATAWGLDARVITPAECSRLWPMLDESVVLGGLHLPTDGLAKAVRAVEAQLRRARARGVSVLDRHEVLDVLRTDDGLKVTGVRTDQGDIEADIVVCCAGFWGPKVAAMVGMTLPLTPLGHQLAWTTPVPSLAGTTDEATRPILRHQDADLYYRENFDGLGIGYYGHRPMPVRLSDVPGVREAEDMPSVLPFTPADFAPAWTESQRLLPDLGGSAVVEGINGIFSFTTDDFPLLGPSAAVEGFWVAEAVWVTHSAGVAAAMAEWLVEGHCSTFDLHECDVNRFESHQLTPDYVLTRDCQNFVEVYDIKHPLQPMEHPRPLRVTPFHHRQQELGGMFLEASGWERPQWYRSNAALVQHYPAPTPDAWASRYWSPIVAAEARHTREQVSMFDMTALKRLEVTGRGATAFLQRVFTGNVDKSVGSITYGLLLDEDGGIRSDVTIARLGRERYQVGANGALDEAWLTRQLPGDGLTQIRDITAGTCCIGLWGPRARDVLAPLTGADVSAEGQKYFRAQQIQVGFVPVTAMRLSYVGELGWELYTTSDQGQKLWDTLWAAGQEHGLIAAGRGAFNSLRLEKGYRSFGTDMTFEHDPWEAGLDFAVRLQKESFLGREAVLARREDVRRRLTCLLIDDAGDTDGTTTYDQPLGKEPVYRDGACVGHVTSAAYGYTVNAPIAYAWLPTELSVPGERVEIGYFDRRLHATVAAEPLFDPEMKRLRS